MKISKHVIEPGLAPAFGIGGLVVGMGVALVRRSGYVLAPLLFFLAGATAGAIIKPPKVTLDIE